MEELVLDAYRGGKRLLIACLGCELRDGSLAATRMVISMSFGDGELRPRDPFAEGFVQSCWREFDTLIAAECLAVLDAESVDVADALRKRVVPRPTVGHALRTEIDECLVGRPPDARRTG